MFLNFMMASAYHAPGTSRLDLNEILGIMHEPIATPSSRNGSDDICLPECKAGLCRTVQPVYTSYHARPLDGA